MNYGKLTAGTTKTAIDTAKPSEKGEIITYLSRMGDVLHYVAERGEVILALVTIHTIGHGHQPYIVLRKKLFGQLADLNVVSAQPGQVFHEYRRDIASLDSLYHSLEIFAFHRSACDTIIHEKDCVRVALILGGLLQYLFLILDAVGLAVHIIVTAQSAVESGCAEFVFFA